MTTHHWTLVAVRLLGALETARAAISDSSRTPRRSAIALSAAALLLIFLGSVPSSYASPLVYQKPLDGTCVPKFAVSLPVFGPADSVPRVDAADHPNLTVTLTEINQPVLPQGFAASCGDHGVRLGKTRVWAFKTQDTNSGRVLGPASLPAVTIVARRGIATRVTYVNQLRSFNPSNPGGPGLVHRRRTKAPQLSSGNRIDTTEAIWFHAGRPR